MLRISWRHQTETTDVFRNIARRKLADTVHVLMGSSRSSAVLMSEDKINGITTPGRPGKELDRPKDILPTSMNMTFSYGFYTKIVAD